MSGHVQLLFPSPEPRMVGTGDLDVQYAHDSRESAAKGDIFQSFQSDNGPLTGWRLGVVSTAMPSADVSMAECLLPLV